jgi:hypothetical protein
MMHYGKMHYVIAFNERENTFIKAWWSPGTHLYLYQMSDRINEKDMRHGVVNVDPMSGNDLSVVIRECWEDYAILDYSTDYSG